MTDETEAQTFSAPLRLAIQVLDRLTVTYQEWYPDLPADAFKDNVFLVLWQDQTINAKQLIGLFESDPDDEKSRPEASDPKRVQQALMLLSCFYASEAIRTGVKGNLEIALEHISEAKYWLGLLHGTSATLSFARGEISYRARNAANKRHAEHHALKAEAAAWFSLNGSGFNKDGAAEEISRKVVPVKFRTARDWVDEWTRESRSARKP